MKPFNGRTTLEFSLPITEAGASLGPRVLVATVLDGPGAGGLLILQGDRGTIGRDPANDLAIPDAGISTNHFRLARLGPRCVVEDLGSTNGTYLNGRRLAAPSVLADGDRIQLGRSTVVGVRFHQPDEVVAIQRMYDSGIVDALTGVYNRRHFDQRLVAEIAFAKRHGSRVSLLLLDVDHFKRVNDVHGHPAGDAVLRAVGQLLRRQVRTEDIACRYGGEEFGIVARGIDAPATLAFAERLRSAIAGLAIHVEDALLNITVSIGVAVSPEQPDVASPEALVMAADRALYQAKASGRDRVCHA